MESNARHRATVSVSNLRRLRWSALPGARALGFALLAFAASPAALAYSPCAWEKQIVAACLVLEASNQGEEGMRAVASVIANRADRDPALILKVVKRPYAFSAFNTATTGKTGSDGYAGHVRRASRDRNWSLANSIVEEMYAQQLADITFGADHYLRRDVFPSWSLRMQATILIGDHLFLRSF